MPYKLSIPLLRKLEERKKRNEVKGNAVRNTNNSGNPFEDEEDEEQEDEEQEDEDDNRHIDLSSDSENENENVNGNGNGNGNGNFFQESPSSSNKTEAYVIPISLAVTDFHFLVLANIQFFRNNQKGKEKEKGGGKGNYKDEKGSRYTEITDRDNRKKGIEKVRGIFSGKSNIFLLAFSRLDGTLSQSIELKTEIPTNRFQISEGPQQQQQSQQHRIMTESRKKNSSDSATTLSSSSAVENDRNEEEGSDICYVEGIPLSVLSDQKMETVWLNTDRGLYQVD